MSFVCPRRLRSRGNKLTVSIGTVKRFVVPPKKLNRAATRITDNEYGPMDQLDTRFISQAPSNGKIIKNDKMIEASLLRHQGSSYKKEKSVHEYHCERCTMLQKYESCDEYL